MIQPAAIFRIADGQGLGAADSPEAQRQRIQVILLRESGMTQPAIAEAMGVSLNTVNRVHMAYDGGGIKALKPRRGHQTKVRGRSRVRRLRGRMSRVRSAAALAS